MTESAKIYAKTLGMIAFENGLKAQPGCDKELMNAVKEAGGIGKEGNNLMRAWIEGWTSANLSANA